MDIQQIISIRSEATKQMFKEDDVPEDVLFYVKNSEISMLLIPLQGNFPQTKKYNARKQILDKILKDRLDPRLVDADEIFYCSIDIVLNVDYCFQIDSSKKKTDLYIVQNGTIIRRYVDYDLNYDERNDISNINNNSTMKDKLKKLFGKKNPTTVEKSKDDNFSKIRASGKGCEVIKISMNAFINQMSSMYPEWQGLFNVSTNDKDVVVWCLKGFDDPTTRQAIPCLWKRKTFIENCKLFGVPKIVFFDENNNTFDLLKVEDIDENTLP